MLKILTLGLLASALVLGCAKKDDAASGDETAAAKPADEGAAADTKEEAKEEAKPAAGGDLTVDEAGKKMVEMMNAMVAAAEAAGEDCDKMGEGFQKVIDDNKSLLEAGKKFDSDEAAKKEFEEKYGNEVMEAMKKMMPLAQKCMTNAKVEAAFKSM